MTAQLRQTRSVSAAVSADGRFEVWLVYSQGGHRVWRVYQKRGEREYPVKDYPDTGQDAREVLSTWESEQEQGSDG